MLALALVAVHFQRHPRLGAFGFTFWALAFTAAALVYPQPFLQIGGFQLSTLIVPLIQIIMFGMGASLSIGDFARALKMPQAVLIGMVLQFTVMPVVGWAIATAFAFPPEIAAGVILIGSCSGGVASNVMVYLARGNVALSVTMTACSTLLAPLATPTAMELLAGQFIPVDFWDMVRSIVRLILVPIVGGLIANKVLRMAGKESWLERVLPAVSMISICVILAIIAAGSRDELLEVGLALVVAAMIHNLLGYLFGYWGARGLRMQESDARTVAIEVGLQNGGMGVALANSVLKSSAAALAPAIFGTWMNVSGSMVASYWRNRPLK